MVAFVIKWSPEADNGLDLISPALSKTDACFSLYIRFTFELA